MRGIVIWLVERHFRHCSAQHCSEPTPRYCRFINRLAGSKWTDGIFP